MNVRKFPIVAMLCNLPLSPGPAALNIAFTHQGWLQGSRSDIPLNGTDH